MHAEKTSLSLKMDKIKTKQFITTKKVTKTQAQAQ